MVLNEVVLNMMVLNKVVLTIIVFFFSVSGIDSMDDRKRYSSPPCLEKLENLQQQEHDAMIVTLWRRHCMESYPGEWGSIPHPISCMTVSSLYCLVTSLLLHESLYNS